MSWVAPELFLFSSSMPHLLHSCPSFFLSTFQQVKSAQGSSHQSLLSGSNCSRIASLLIRGRWEGKRAGAWPHRSSAILIMVTRFNEESSLPDRSKVVSTLILISQQSITSVYLFVLHSEVLP